MVAQVAEVEVTTERLEAEACTLASQIASSACRFLEVVAELDRRESWREWGCKSMAHWLNWKCALGLVAARQHVRVAHALEKLPLTRAEFAAGRLSYSKVRALTRVATPAREARLVEHALLATASQVENAVRGYERTKGDASTLERRRGWVFYEDDGTVCVTLRFTRDGWENVKAGADAVGRGVSAGQAANDSAESRLLDAIEYLAMSYLAGNAHAPKSGVVVRTSRPRNSRRRRSRRCWSV
jgi:uncharacterized protein DUF222